MNEQLEGILHQVSKSPLIDNGELQKAYRLVISSLHKGLNIQRAGVWFVRSDYSEINCQLLIDTYHQTEIEALTISALNYPQYLLALKGERAILANDAHTNNATSEFSEGYLTPLEISSMLDVPIRHKGEMIGIICCEHIGNKRQWSEDEATFAGSLADLIGRAINAHAFKESEQKLNDINNKLEQTIKERTAQLVESEKMAALGNLVAGIAHEVNTPLGISITASSAITDSIKKLEKAMIDGRLSEGLFKSFLQESYKLLFMLEHNLGRAADLIHHFKQTAVDHSDQNIHIFDVKKSLGSLVLSLKTEMTKHGVNVKIDIVEKLTIYSYPSAWSQIFSNLILNSCNHAFENNNNPEINIKISTMQDKIIAEYIDNGCGIPEENIAQIMLPFFTTKRGQGGTGLGLSIVYNLITEQLKGTIEIKSELGKGINILIECPLTTLPQ